MTALLSFLLKANLTFILLYGVFLLCFRPDTFYGYNRRYLLVTILSAVIFPLLNFSPLLSGNPTVVEISQYIPDVELMYQYLAAQMQPEFTQPKTEYFVEPIVAKAFPFGLFLWWCWMAVAVLMLVKRLFQYTCIVRLWRLYPQYKYGNSSFIAVDRKIQPFSFFGHIFLNPALYSSNELLEILTHEQIHCRQKHSYDILLVEAFVCLFWFNPIAWLLRRDLKQNLEYQTDQMTLHRGINCKQYQYSLLRVAGYTFQIVNHFHFYKFNHIKKRIIMLNKKETPRIMAAKYLLVVPALAAVLLTVQASGLQVTEINVANSVDESTAQTVFDASEINESNIAAETTVAENKKPVAAVTKKAEIVPDLTVSAQTPDKLVSGTVTNTEGQPLPGVSVVVKGTTTGSVTDMNGKYSLTVPVQSVLQFSFVGVASLEIVVENQQTINVVMQKDKLIGNGSINSVTINDNQTKIEADNIIYGLGENNNPYIFVDGKEFIGKINSIPPEQIESISVLKEQSAIVKYGEKGINGVILVTTKRGANKEIMAIDYSVPDKYVQPIVEDIDIEIRGLTPGNKPLIIVDGKEFDGSINSLSPDQIESIMVLKAYSSFAEYGEKGKNGVVLITTKK